jgi:hypothetical protein
MKGTLCQLSYRGAVLTPGVEPDPTAYQTVMQTAYTRSGRKVEVPTPRGLSRARAFKARCRAGGAPSVAETRGLDPQWLIATHPVSNRGRPGPVQLPYAEGARIERAWDASPNLGLANRCHCHSASLPSCARRESNSHGPSGPRGSEPRVSTVPPPALGADGRLRSGDLGVGNAALYLLSYICMEPPTGIGPRDLGRTRTVLCH